MSAVVQSRSCADLTKLPGVWRGGEIDRSEAGVPTGHPELDRELPGGGWPRGTLTEILHDGVGLGEVSLLLGGLKRAAEEGRAIAWVNPPHLPYAPALALAGVPLDSCVGIRPLTNEDALWAAEQALRSGACAAVLSWFSEKTDYAWLRRLQMAAQAGRALAVLWRPSASAALATPAHLRLVLTREEGSLAIRIPKRRGPPLTNPIRIANALGRPRVACMAPSASRACGRPALAACHR